MRTWPSLAATTYRMYDIDGTLLYVGSSSHIMQRLRDHEYSNAHWVDVARIDIEHHANLAAAIRSERNAYQTEVPAWNKVEPALGMQGYGRESVTYQTLRDFVEEHEYAPSIDELRQLLGLKSVSATKGRLDSLIRMGLIRRVGPRAIEFIDA